MLERFKSRKFLLTVLAQIVGLVVLFLPEHADKAAFQTTAETIGSMLLMALTAFGYIRAEGRVDEARASAEAFKSHTPPPAGPFNNLSGPGILGLLALSFVLGGCNATPLRTTMQSRQAYTATLNVLSTLAENGKFTIEQLRDIEKGRQAAAIALDSMEAAALANKKLDFQFALDTFNRTLEGLIRQQVLAQREVTDAGSGSSDARPGDSPGIEPAAANHRQRPGRGPGPHARGDGGRQAGPDRCREPLARSTRWSRSFARTRPVLT
jgi:hypothetical protein